ncbi:hypothetical protein EDB84DRAFT_1677050, partial [Lactarius hengduanensis]
MKVLSVNDGRQFPGSSSHPPILTVSIQCDSKHPRCTACATAGTPCHQEDRHRQTLTLRGHTEHLEQKLAQCDAILKRCIPGFELESLEEILVREGVEVEANVPPISASFQFTPGPGGSSPPKGYPYVPPGPHMIPPGYPPMPPYYAAPPNGAPYLSENSGRGL